MLENYFEELVVFFTPGIYAHRKMIRLLDATNCKLPEDDNLKKCQDKPYVIISHVW